MTALFHILSPILLMVLLGVGLARIRFLGAAFMADLNKLAFWVALPALLFRSVAHAAGPGPQTWDLLAVMLVATTIAAVLGWVASVVLREPRRVHGTFSQAAFRGNLAYIAIPVLSYAFAGSENRVSVMATAVIVMTLLMAYFNVLAVVVLQASQERFSWRAVGSGLRAIATNPLLLAGVAGLPFGLAEIPLPLFLDRTLEALGGAAVPIALLCIGGSLSVPKLSRAGGILVAALIKTAVVPAVVWMLAPAFGVAGDELRIALVLAAAPTAAAAYIMALQMGGDEVLASGSIVVSTVFAGVSLAVVLWLTG